MKKTIHCPQCSFTGTEEFAECPFCGLLIEKYSQAATAKTVIAATNDVKKNNNVTASVLPKIINIFSVGCIMGALLAYKTMPDSDITFFLLVAAVFVAVYHLKRVFGIGGDEAEDTVWSSDDGDD